MPNATNISVMRDDGTSITLVPVSSMTEKGLTTLIFREQSATKPIMACVTLTLQSEKLKSGVMKITRKLEVPIMAIIPLNAVNSDGRTAAPAVDHVETDIRVRFHSPLSTGTERADSLRMANHIDCSGSATANSGVFAGAVTANAYRDIGSAYQIPYADIQYVWPSA